MPTSAAEPCDDTPAFDCDKPPSGEQVWVRRSTGTANFAFVIGKLDANACYGFQITQHIGPLSEDERKKVREPLAKMLRTKLDDAFKDQDLSGQEIKEIIDKLNEEAKKTIQAQLFACPPHIAPDDAEIRGILRSAVDTKSAKSNIDNARIELRRAFCLEEPCVEKTREWATQLRDELAKLVNDPAQLSAGSAMAWNAPINPSREGHVSTTMAHVARAIASSNEGLKSLIDGTVKFAGPNLEAAKDDRHSIGLLADFLDVYASSSFRRKQEESVGTEPVVDPSGAANVRRFVLGGAQSLAKELETYATTKQKFDASGLPELLADAMLKRGHNLTATPTVITDGKNPYIGADIGIAYVFDLRKGFPYFGANFYRIPVNKDEKRVKDEKDPQYFWKRASLLVGFTTGIDGTKSLLGPGNLMLGAGWRFSRYVKASGGAVGFKQKDANPLVDKEHVKVKPFVSISVDADLKQFLGGLTKLFGL
jgi:hypothetical protein